MQGGRYLAKVSGNVQVVRSDCARCGTRQLVVALGVADIDLRGERSDGAQAHDSVAPNVCERGRTPRHRPSPGHVLTDGALALSVLPLEKQICYHGTHAARGTRLTISLNQGGFS